MPKTESQQTQDLLQDLKKSRHDWMIIKHSDRFSKGVPDLSISLGRQTLWLERKKLKAKQRLDKPCTWVDNLVQLETLVRLDGWYHAYDPAVDGCLIIKATTIRPLVIEKAQLSPVMFKEGMAVLELELLIEQYLGGVDVDL